MQTSSRFHRWFSIELENNLLLFESNDLTKKPNFQFDELKIGCKVRSVERLRIIIAVFAGQQRPIPRNNPTYSTFESQESILIFEFRYSIFPYYVLKLSLSPLGYLLIQGWRRVYGNFRVICSCTHESIRRILWRKIVEKDFSRVVSIFLDFYLFVRFANWKNVFWKSCPVFIPFSKIFFFLWLSFDRNIRNDN